MKLFNLVEDSAIGLGEYIQIIDFDGVEMPE
jgi:hypothetical protein